MTEAKDGLSELSRMFCKTRYPSEGRHKMLLYRKPGCGYRPRLVAELWSLVPQRVRQRVQCNQPDDTAHAQRAG